MIKASVQEVLPSSSGSYSSPDHAKPAARSLTSAVYQQLREDILSGDLPPGTKLLIASLTSRFGVSSSVVRESVSRLTADNLAELVDQKGFRVTPVSRRDWNDLCMLRTEIEALALRRAVANGNEAWINEICAAFDALEASLNDVHDSHASVPAYEALNDRFHMALIATCDSVRLMTLRKQLFEHAARYRLLARRMGAGARARHESHRRLYEAARARDVDSLVEEMKRHILGNYEAVLDGLPE